MRTTSTRCPIRIFVARCEGDCERGINKRAEMLKLLVSQFLTQMLVFKCPVYASVGPTCARYANCVPRHGGADACCRSISPIFHQWGGISRTAPGIISMSSVPSSDALCFRWVSSGAPSCGAEIQTETLPRALVVVSVGIDAHGHSGKAIQVNYQLMRYKHEDRGVEERPQAGVSAAKLCKRGDSALIIAMGATSGIVCLTRPTLTTHRRFSRRYRCKERCLRKRSRLT
jgi:hypothetical protein